MATNGSRAKPQLQWCPFPTAITEPPTAAWQTLTTASHGTDPSRNVADTLSVSYILSIVPLFAFTTPNDLAPLSLDLDFRPFLI